MLPPGTRPRARWTAAAAAAMLLAALAAVPAVADDAYTGAGSLGVLAPGAAPGAGPSGPSGSGPAGCVPVGTAQLSPGPPPNPSHLGIDAFAVAPNQDALPARVDLRTATTSFSRFWEFALVDRVLFTRPHGSAEPWRTVPLPGCLVGRLVGISVDDDELTAIDDNGWLYTMDNAAHPPILWNWTSSFGAPLWMDRGQRMPGGHGDWALSVHAPQVQRTYTDTAGHQQFVGSAKCTMVTVLVGDGSRIVYLDPWLPNDYSYEIGSPLGGRFQAESMSTAASVTFVMNRYGDMYTRLFDFDISGADTVFFKYSWQDQSGKLPPADQFAAALDPRVARIQLPAPEWVQQPKVPGTITSTISIHATGAPGSDARELRVEGVDAHGRTGFWHKMLADDAWAFTPTGAALTGDPVENSPQDRSLDTLAPPAPYDYTVPLPDRGAARGYRLEVAEFAWATSERTATVIAPDGTRFPVELHTVDGMRMTPRGPGLDSVPRAMSGAIGLTQDLWDTRDAQSPAVRTFADAWLGGQRRAPIDLTVTDTTMAITRSEGPGLLAGLPGS
ncbi:hypothetical protein [Tomitella fengzijianii]|uniref:hypothetical protein n=1 Tax=Tomitella fengzijianii TaxID=2597660 RepID=UPI001E452B1C|nr:hypothetical protein [Tomitella fengzijianii]